MVKISKKVGFAILLVLVMLLIVPPISTRPSSQITPGYGSGVGVTASKGGGSYDFSYSVSAPSTNIYGDGRDRSEVTPNFLQYGHLPVELVSYNCSIAETPKYAPLFNQSIVDIQTILKVAVFSSDGSLVTLIERVHGTQFGNRTTNGYVPVIWNPPDLSRDAYLSYDKTLHRDYHISYSVSFKLDLENGTQIASGDFSSTFFYNDKTVGEYVVNKTYAPYGFTTDTVPGNLRLIWNNIYRNSLIYLSFVPIIAILVIYLLKKRGLNQN